MTDQSPDYDATAEAVLTAISEYEQACEDRRRRMSVARWGHPGAYVAEAFPDHDGRRTAVAAALARVIPPEVRD